MNNNIIPSWVNPPVFNPMQHFTAPGVTGTDISTPSQPGGNLNIPSVQPVQPKQNAMQKLPQPIQQFFQMLMSGDLSSLKGFQGLQSVDHNPFGSNNPFQTQQPFQNIGQNINKWGTNDTRLGMYGT